MSQQTTKKEYSTFSPEPRTAWVGFRHFEAFFNAPQFGTIMRNTIIISLLKLIVGFPAGLEESAQIDGCSNWESTGISSFHSQGPLLRH